MPNINSTNIYISTDEKLPGYAIVVSEKLSSES